MRKLILWALLILDFSAYSTAQAANYKFTSIVRDNQTDFTLPQGINDSGQISGYWIKGSNVEGFVYLNGKFTDIVAPKATATTAFGINNSGKIVGTFAKKRNTDNNYSFQKKLKPIKTTNIQGFPSNATLWGVQGISNDGAMVGYWNDTSGIYHGFIIAHGVFTSIDFPGVNFTTAQGINNSGTVVGFYQDSEAHGFIRTSDGQLTSVDIPGAVYTTLQGINDLGDIVGIASFPAPVGPDTDHGILLDNSSSAYTQIDFPNADNTELYGINNNGQIVGTEDRFDTSGVFGFVGVRQ